MDDSLDDLVRSRVLPTEDKYVKRINRNVLKVEKLVNWTLTSPRPERPPGFADKDSGAKIDPEEDLTVAMLKDLVDMDHDLFATSLLKIQIANDMNASEVERYEQEKVKIVQDEQIARDTIAKQRDELLAAQQEKENRLEYDAIAMEIFNSKSLKPRDEQAQAIARLNAEIEELEKERDSDIKLWETRRDHFSQITNLLDGMVDEIKREKEEQERREGMDEEEEGEEVEHGKDRDSAVPSGGNTPFHQSTPSFSGGLTPAAQRLLHKNAAANSASKEASSPAPSNIDIVITDAPPLKDDDMDKMDTT
ncbi:hypothetical protein BJ508DRAFT_328458 [Ascobolus immersus RN42]|uniref:Tho complex subunit 7/Mft1p n=1 Tax=Ascobolus immersus RN42 TaxID=1160509 RepID=A0A3N4HZU2_ASCIM|nr:hypothetical protein BJ508DRAFT_328458 [Ascobolus immersus RN42]